MKGGIRVRVAALLVDGQGRLLLVNHRKAEHSYWLLPGGGLRHGESPLDCLRRELREELGARVRAGDLLFVASTISPTGDRHILHLVFGGVWEEEPPAEFHSSDPRVVGAAWVGKSELRTRDFHPDMKEEILSYLETGQRPRVYVPAGWIP